MDNFTLIAAINIVLLINIIFTFIMKKNTGESGLKEWRISALLLFSGFCLLMMQNLLPPLISFCIANYFILAGQFYQINAAVVFEFRKGIINRFFFPAVSVIYWALFIYFTFVLFNTPSRIIVISAFLVVFYTYGIVMMMRIFFKNGKNNFHTPELFYLFIFSSLFFLLRIAVTVDGMGAVRSLYERNIPTTMTFIYVIVFNMIYPFGMFNAFLRKRNNLIIKEKEKFNHLFDFINDTAKHLNIEELYSEIEKILRKSLGINTAAIFLADETGEILKPAYSFNDLKLPGDILTEIKSGVGATGRAYEQDRVIEIDIDNYPDRVFAERFKKTGLRTLISAPIKSSEGIIGAVTASFPHKPDNEILEKDFFYYLGEQIGIVLQNALLYEKVKMLASVDPLTGLLNRRKMLELFEQEIKRISRSKKTFTIAMADIDNFKGVNDTYGHECGDMVLKSVSSLFREECRESDYICRWGGEEFLLLFIDSDLSSAKKIAERIRRKSEEKINPCMENCPATLSIGISEYKRDLNIEQLLQRADNALYKAKEKGKNRIELFKNR